MHALYDEIAPALREYVEQAVLPHYDAFDAAHRRDHALLVMSQSLKLVATLRQQGESVDAAMAWTIAAFHDTGMSEGRATWPADASSATTRSCAAGSARSKSR